MLKQLCAGIAALTLIPAYAFAEEGHSHAGKHGGLRADSGHHHVELVAKDGSIEFYVEDEEGAPENVKDAKGSATLLVDGKKIDIQLAPADDGSALKGSGDFRVVKGSVAVITLTMPGHKPEQSRFKLN